MNTRIKNQPLNDMEEFRQFVWQTGKSVRANALYYAVCDLLKVYTTNCTIERHDGAENTAQKCAALLTEREKDMFLELMKKLYASGERPNRALCFVDEYIKEQKGKTL